MSQAEQREASGNTRDAQKVDRRVSQLRQRRSEEVAQQQQATSSPQMAPKVSKFGMHADPALLARARARLQVRACCLACMRPYIVHECARVYAGARACVCVRARARAFALQVCQGGARSLRLSARCR